MEFSCPYSSYVTSARLLQKYEELELEIKQLTGKDLKCLKVLFAQGWTLEPPKKQPTLLEAMAELADEDKQYACGDCVHYRIVEDYYDDGSYTEVEYCDGDNYRPCSYYREACEHFCKDE